MTIKYFCKRSNDKLEIVVVFVGTDRLDAAIKQDEQVYSRFCAHRRFGKLAGEEFKKTVAISEEKVLKLPGKILPNQSKRDE